MLLRPQFSFTSASEITFSAITFYSARNLSLFFVWKEGYRPVVSSISNKEKKIDRSRASLPRKKRTCLSCKSGSMEKAAI